MVWIEDRPPHRDDAVFDLERMELEDDRLRDREAVVYARENPGGFGWYADA